MAKIDAKQEHPWLLARLRDLRLDAERFRRTADNQEWVRVADQLSQVISDIIEAEQILREAAPDDTAFGDE